MQTFSLHAWSSLSGAWQWWAQPGVCRYLIMMFKLSLDVPSHLVFSLSICPADKLSPVAADRTKLSPGQSPQGPGVGPVMMAKFFTWRPQHLQLCYFSYVHLSIILSVLLPFDWDVICVSVSTASMYQGLSIFLPKYMQWLKLSGMFLIRVLSRTDRVWTGQSPTAGNTPSHLWWIWFMRYHL